MALSPKAYAIRRAKSRFKRSEMGLATPHLSSKKKSEIDEDFFKEWSLNTRDQESFVGIRVHKYLEFLNRPEIKKNQKDIEYIGKYIGWYLKKNESNFLGNQISEQTEFLYLKVTMSPGCKVFATLGFDRVVHVRNFDTRKLILRIDQSFNDIEFAFSFDSAFLAIRNRASISIWELNTSREIFQIKGKYSCLAWSKEDYKLGIVSRMDFCLEIYTRHYEEWIKVLEEPLKLSEREVHSIDFSKDGSLLCSAGVEGHLSIWDLNEVLKKGSKPMLEIELDDNPEINVLIFSPKETHIIAGTNDAKVIIWDKNPMKKPTILQGHKQAIIHLLCSPDQTRLISMGAVNNMLIWNFEEEMLMQDISHCSAATSLSLLNEENFVTSGVDNFLLIRSFKDGQIIEEPDLTYGDDEGIEVITSRYATDPEGNLIAKYHDTKNIISFWDTNTGEILRKTSIDPSIEVSMMCFSRTGQELAIAAKDRVMIYGTQQENLIIMEPTLVGIGDYQKQGSLVRSVKRLLSKNMSNIEKEKHDIQTMMFLSTGELCLGDEAGFLTICPLPNSGNQSIRSKRMHKSGLTSLAQSPNAQFLATGSTYGNVRIWNIETLNTDQNTFDFHKESIKAMIFLDEFRLVSGCAAGKIKLWKLKDLGLSIVFPYNPKAVLVPNFFNSAAGGELLLVGYETGEVIVWSFQVAAAGRPEVLYCYQSYDGRNMTAMINSSEKETAALKTVSSTHMKKIQLWSINSVKTFKIKNAKEATSNGGYIFSVVAPINKSGSVSSPTKKKKVKADAGADALKIWKIRLWDGITGKKIGKELINHYDDILFLKVSPDNYLLLSGDVRGKINVWDIETQTLLQGPLSTEAAANIGKFSHDNETFAIGEIDGHFSVWRTKSGIRKTRMKGHDGEIVCLDDMIGENESFWVTGGKDLKVIVWDGDLIMIKWILPEVFESSIVNVKLWDGELYVAGEDYTSHNIKCWKLDDSLSGVSTEYKKEKSKTLLNSYNMCPLEHFDKILTYYHDSKNLYYFMILDKDVLENDQTIIVDTPVSREEGEVPLHNVWASESDLICFFDNRVVVYRNLFKNEQLFLKKMLEICEFSQKPNDPAFANKLIDICSGKVGVVFPFMYNLLQAIAYTDDSSDDDNLLEKIVVLLEKTKSAIELDTFFEKDIHGRNLFDIVFSKKNADLLNTLILYIIEKYPEFETINQANQMINYFTVKRLNDMLNIFDNQIETISKFLDYMFNSPINFPVGVYPALETPFYLELPSYQINKQELDEIMKKIQMDQQIWNKNKNKKTSAGYEIVRAKCLYARDLLDHSNSETLKFWKKVSNIDPQQDNFGTVFGNKTLVRVLEYKWEKKWQDYGKKFFFYEGLYFLIFLTAFVANSSYVLKYRLADETDGETIYDSGYSQASFALDIGLFCFLIHHIYSEVSQALHFTFKEYFDIIWNYFDVLLIFLCMPALIVDILNCCGVVDDSESLKILNSLTLFFGFLRLISYARGIDGSAFMVRLIIEVIIDMRYFLLFMFVFILGLGYCGYEIEVNFGYSHFDAWNTFFTAMLGDTSMLWEMDTDNYYVLYAFFIIASIILTITLLNLLISIISETFGRVREMEKYTRVYERWNIQTEIDVSRGEGLRGLALELEKKEKKELNYLIYFYNDKHAKEEEDNKQAEKTRLNLEKNRKACEKVSIDLKSFSQEIEKDLKENEIWMKDNFKKFTEDEQRKSPVTANK